VSSFIERQTAQVMNFLDRIDQASQNAAATDEAGNWGLDGWIRLYHDLFDMQVRTVASAAEAAITAPWWRDQPPSELNLLEVEHRRPYPRRFEVLESFQRLGIPSQEVPDEGGAIPDTAIDFDPQTLPAGEVAFQIKVPEQYQGSNYRGTIRLIEWGATNPDHPQEIQTIIVGL
jgi:hypothetical protein